MCIQKQIEKDSCGIDDIKMRYFGPVVVEIRYFEVTHKSVIFHRYKLILLKNKRQHHGAGAKISLYKMFQHPQTLASKWTWMQCKRMCSMTSGGAAGGETCFKDKAVVHHQQVSWWFQRWAPPPYHHPLVVEEDMLETSSKIHNKTILKVGELWL